MDKLKHTSKISANTTNYSNFSKLNASKFKTFGKSKARSEIRLFPNSKRFFPFLTMEKYSSNFLNNTKSSQELQRTLSFNKNKMLKNKNDLRDLKIQFTKLHEENEINRTILAKMLNLTNDNFCSKEEILEKIKGYKIDKEEKIIAENINIIDLKLELNEKKSILKSTNYEYNNLKENSKYKNIIEIKKQLLNNVDIKKEIVSDIQQLKNILEKNKKLLEEKEQEHKMLNIDYKEMKSKEKNFSEEQRKIKSKYIILKELISKLDQKMQLKEIKFKKFCKTKIELMNSIEENEIAVKEIKDYLSKREQNLSKLQKRRDIIKSLVKKVNEIEKEYLQFYEENNDLSQKLVKSEINSKKLDKKIKEDKREKNSMFMENNLKKIKFDLESIKKEYQIKKNKLKEINDKNNEEIENNNIMIENKKNIISNLEKKKKELELTLKNAKKKSNNLLDNSNNKENYFDFIQNDEINEIDKHINEEINNNGDFNKTDNENILKDNDLIINNNINNKSQIKEENDSNIKIIKKS